MAGGAANDVQPSDAPDTNGVPQAAVQSPPVETSDRELEYKLKYLQKENKRLRQLVTSKQNKPATKCGYLYKYRGFVTWSFWQSSWDLRFFTLNGSVLQYYKTEKDIEFHPRGHIDITGCTVEWEDLKKGRYYTFGIVDRGGNSLVRMSTEHKDTAWSWVQALEHAGAQRRELKRRDTSPLRSADIRWKPDTLQQPSPSPSPAREAENGVLRHRWRSPDRDDADSTASGQGVAGRAGYTSESGLSESGAIPRSLPPGSTQYQKDAGKRRSPMVASSPMHTERRASVLSSDRVQHQKHYGLVVLVGLIVTATHLRLILENFRKYSILVDPRRWVARMLAPPRTPELMWAWVAMLVCAIVALGIEKLAVAWLEAERKAGVAKRKKEVRPSDARALAKHLAKAHDCVLWPLHALNTSAALVVPCAIVHYTGADFLPGFAVTMFTITLWMKLVSYAHCNWDLRRARRLGEVRAGERGAAEAPIGGVERQLVYPENITATNLAYFLVAPTLVYQLVYPMSSRCRPRWLMRRFSMLLVYLSLQIVLIEQYIAPTIEHSLEPFSRMDWSHLVERILKLSLPTVYFWLLTFMVLFHEWLNILAELTRFGDREFYKEWWNATTIGEYWRMWNMPVHKWMLRHLYYPAITMRVPAKVAGVLVFMLSAVFHELAVALPLHINYFVTYKTGLRILFPLYAFWGIMFQVPLMFFTEWLAKKIKSSETRDLLGNAVFWTCFCFLGQPLALMLYFHDWVILNQPERLHGPVSTSVLGAAINAASL